MLDESIKQYIDRSVLVWLATTDLDGMPNVSPKEIFQYIDEDILIIANIASPGSIKNIKKNPKVAVSFIDVYRQKGFQLKGMAQIISQGNEKFGNYEPVLKIKLGDSFKIISIIEISIEKSKLILAPSYQFYTDTSEEEQIANAIKTYQSKI